MTTTTTTSTLESYLTRHEARAHAPIRALDRLIRAACPQLDVAVKYNILMYTLDEEWGTWVCALDVTKKGPCLRFLHGTMLSDPLGVLRGGSSVLMNWDFAWGDAPDERGVMAYVAEAVAHRGEYKANRKAILAKSRAAAAEAGRRPSAAPAAKKKAAPAAAKKKAAPAAAKKKAAPAAAKKKAAPAATKKKAAPVAAKKRAAPAAAKKKAAPAAAKKKASPAAAKKKTARGAKGA